MDSKEIARKLRELANEIENGVPIVTQPAPGPTIPTPITGNPYADTDDLVPLKPDVWLKADRLFFDPLLQSRCWRKLWDTAHDLNMPIVILRGGHDDLKRTVDVRYPVGRESRIKFIQAILDTAPLYDKDKEYNKWATEDSEVRLSPEFKADMFPNTQKVQGDPAGGHDDNPMNGHIHIRFANEFRRPA